LFKLWDSQYEKENKDFRAESKHFTPPCNNRFSLEKERIILWNPNKTERKPQQESLKLAERHIHKIITELSIWITLIIGFLEFHILPVS
jgi:hypothetical protein